MKYEWFAYISNWYRGSSIEFVFLSVLICSNYNSIRQRSIVGSRAMKWNLVAESVAELPPSDSSYESAFCSSAKWSYRLFWCHSLHSSSSRRIHRYWLYRHDWLLESMTLRAKLTLLVANAFGHSNINLLLVTISHIQTLIERHAK